ncbi:undecaprenyl-diphosphatase [Vibrio fluvialis]|uniref:undecaprenyl-diphosphatase n=1 Tax=Vibrio furnissii TaxID=29494 RepID=UPI001C9C5F87|nr:undecaprenyl-diphosphatase [Vibrio furnissii]MBY8126173.1 undecaprenyl-diphosphatase [Vibrio fluvialis]UHJ60393.1 undecaprenyl-diphosphatase [Vibrio furnissii]
MFDNIETFNHWLFLLINSSSYPETVSLIIVKFFAELPMFLISLCLLTLWFRDRCARSVALNAGVTATLALLVNYIISLIWFHNRPFVDHIGLTLINHAADSSFPSDHITLFASVGFYLFYEKSFRKLGVALLALSLTTGWARIFVGVHYPIDILGAYAISGILSLIYHRYLCGLFSSIINVMLYISDYILVRLSRLKISFLNM